jgi:Fe-S-cluster-containing hydrogenase component 2
MEKLLLVDPNKCTGCGTCEIVCSLKHVKESNPIRSNINALRYEKQGTYYYSIPVVCQQCETPMCKTVCPVAAIAGPNPDTGAYLIDEDACIGCRLCLIACPVGGIHIDETTNKASKCDLCDGDPLCSKFCIPGAITAIVKDKVGLARKREAAEKMSKAVTLIAGST